MTSDLFSGAARRQDPDTAKRAARAVEAEEISVLVTYCLRQHGPQTAEEIADRLGRELGSITPRLAPLERAGLIARTGDRRPGKSGATRIVWECLL